MKELMQSLCLASRKIRSSPKGGYLVNHARVLVGSGLETYENGKACGSSVQNWRHFGLDRAFVNPKTPIQAGVKFCVCVKQFLPWVVMPLWFALRKGKLKC